MTDSGAMAERREMALNGVRVLDLTKTLAGALASSHLGTYGAEVVRIGVGEELLGGASGICGLAEHLVANRNKSLLRLDLGSPESRSQCQRLALAADVVIADSSEEQLEELGLDARTIGDRNPGAIYAWMPAGTTRGPMRVLPPDELFLWAWTGMADQQPASEDRPVAPVLPLIAYEQAALAATAIVAALIEEERSGRGRTVTVSGIHGVAALNLSIMVDLPGVIRAFSGPKDIAWGPPNFRMYRTRDDKWIFLAALTAPFFFSALEVMDLWDVMLQPDVEGDFNNLRLPEVQPRVAQSIANRIAERDLGTWRDAFDGARVPNAPVESREQWARSGTVAANDLLVTLRHEQLGEVVVPGVPAMLSATPGRTGWLPDQMSVIEQAPSWDIEVSDRPRDVEPEGRGLPLEGVHVLDISSYIAGPVTSTILQDFGATVHKVEQPAGDPFRLAGASYSAINRGKGQVVADLKSATVRQQFQRLVERADVVIDNMREGVAAELGVSYPKLRALNPGVIRCGMAAWGNGPLRDAPAFDPLLQARSGLMEAQGGPKTPTIQAVAVNDLGGATLSAFGIVVALYERTRSHRGQEVLTSLARTSVIFQSAEFTSFEGRRPPLIGNSAFLGDVERHRLYRCSDGWVAIGAEPAVIAKDLGAGELIPSEECVALVEVRLATMSADDAVRMLDARGVAAAKAIGRNAIFDDPNMVESGAFFQITDPEFGAITAMRSFAEWSGSSPIRDGRVRALGEDTGSALG